ncbi:GNAT family N-acetyltransferase (plasmid) [Streptomyces sp. BHT-5-2]|uniref:GNAT family N-acetyltransferase n=1 Tax=Streptomyces sp. BHT-5-2 TaxID=2866715 RepID=UPI001C8DABDF|nr:GNAT family protein [Streptomyces sp. BHT-5-2]QZL07766.1 GNAT family N-acetyltransferase [Streptomyces sp. BHT-5-2]
MTTTLRPAAPHDIAELRQLYFEVYGHGYPVALGSDPTEMHRLITDPHSHWLVARRADTGELVGSVVVQTDPGNRLGKLVGLAVHPEHRGGGLAGRLTGAVTADAFATGALDSIHTTVRLVTQAPQRVVARNGYRPLGLLPNAADVSGCETLALFACYAEGVLERREQVTAVPRELLPLLGAAEESIGIPYTGTLALPAPVPDTDRPLPQMGGIGSTGGTGGTALAEAPPGTLLTAPAVTHAEPRTRPRTRTPMEVITAPGFVRRRFRELFPDPAGAYSPLRTPNTVLASPDGEFEIYADLDRAAGSCALVAVHPHPWAATGALDSLMTVLGRAGADYVETLVPLSDTAGLYAFLASGFVPSAGYPAMRRVGDRFHDYVLLSRTDRQIDFRSTAVGPLVRPYQSAYLTAWASIYLPPHEVVR